MNSLERTHYGYEYKCPLSGHVDYVGIGNAASRSGSEYRMKSHLRNSSNRMLKIKLCELAETGISPQYSKVVGELSRLDACKWEAARIFELGTAATGTGPLFNMKLGDIDFLLVACFGSLSAFFERYRTSGSIVDVPTLNYRVATGWSPDEAATTAPVPVNAFGRRFINLQELHSDARCIVPYEALIVRVFKGDDPELAATRPIEWACAWGQRFSGLQALSEDPRCLAEYNFLLSEVKRGCQHEAAAVSACGPVVVRGRLFPDLDALVDSPICAVGRHTLLRRIQQESWAVERAVTEPLGPEEPFNGSSALGSQRCGHRACRKKARDALRFLTSEEQLNDSSRDWDWHLESAPVPLEETIAEAHRIACEQKKELDLAKKGGYEVLATNGELLTLKTIEVECRLAIERAKSELASWEAKQDAVESANTCGWFVDL